MSTFPLESPWRHLRQWANRNPEMGVIGLSLGAWAAMVPHLFGGLACHQLSFWADWQAFVLMVLAMMGPLLRPALRHTANRSFRSRQQRSIVLQMVGWLLPWSAMGLLVAAVLSQPISRSPWWPAVAFGLGAIWACSPIYRVWMQASHRTLPLHPVGWRADWSCLRLGLAQGIPCVGACAPLMVGCALTGHGAVAMLGGAFLAYAERRSVQPRRWLAPFGAAALAGWFALVASRATAL